MRRHRTSVLLASLVCSTPSSGQEARPDHQVSAAARAAAEHETAFALDLHRALAPDDALANVFASPLSVWTALAMLAEGAGGETLDELSRALAPGAAGSPVERLERLRAGGAELRALLEAASGVELARADALWGDRSFAFDETVVARLLETWGARLEALEIANDPDGARARINRWVEEQTRGLIEDLLPAGALTARTKLVLTDAVWFKGLWEHPFDANRTRPARFRRADGSDVQVPFLWGEPEPVRVAFLDAAGRPRPPAEESRGGTIVLELPYEGGTVVATFLVPDAADGLDALERELDAARLAALVGALVASKVEVRMPKLELAQSYDLAAPLAKLGLARLFDPDRADLSAFAADPARGADLYVTGAFHEAFVRVDEAGTEAAAATGVVVGVTSAPAPSLVVTLDQPFLVLIRHASTGTVLFLGRVADPR